MRDVKGLSYLFCISAEPFSLSELIVSRFCITFPDWFSLHFSSSSNCLHKPTLISPLYTACPPQGRNISEVCLFVSLLLLCSEMAPENLEIMQLKCINKVQQRTYSNAMQILIVVGVNSTVQRCPANDLNLLCCGCCRSDQQAAQKNIFEQPDKTGGAGRLMTFMWLFKELIWVVS